MSATSCQCSAQWGCKNATLMEANKQNCSDFVENPWNIGQWNINFHIFPLTIGSSHSSQVIFRSKALQKCHKNAKHEFSFLWPNQALCNAGHLVPAHIMSKCYILTNDVIPICKWYNGNSVKKVNRKKIELNKPIYLSIYCISFSSKIWSLVHL